MNSRLTMLLLCSPALLGNAPEKPVFSTPINLFKHRNLTGALNIQKQLNKEFPDLNPTTLEAICAYLAKSFTPAAIAGNTGRQVPEIGFDAKRLNASTATTHQPNTIVATFSGKETLHETVNALSNAKVAHNFIIDTNGAIHQTKLEGESDDEALMHRPFDIGVSGFVENGFTETRDMNAQIISIYVVGLDTQQATPEQIQAMINLVGYLSSKFSIKPTHVLDYGCIALHPTQEAGAKDNPNNLATLYGRRKTQPNLPWKELAEHHLAIWPREHDPRLDLSTIDHEKLPIWTSLALRKIGFLCPPTTNRNNPDLQGALMTFQQHYQCDNQTGLITEETISRLNSILIQHEEHNPILRDILPPALPIKK